MTAKENNQMEKVVVAGVGMTPFATPRKAETYDVMGEKAIRAALADAGIDFSLIQQAYGGYVYGDSVSGQRVLYRVGQTGIPFVNVNNNCASGSSALWLARQAIESGAADCVLAFGFEQMQRGALTSHWTDRPDPLGSFLEVVDKAFPSERDVPFAPRLFGAAGQQYMERYGAKAETFAKVSVKSRQHASRNPFAVFRDPVTLEEVMGSPHVSGPLTRLQCCPPTSGAGAAILCSEDFAVAHGMEALIRIRAQAMTSDTTSTFQSDDFMALVGFDMAQQAARQVYDASGVGPEDISVVELHDCFTVNEVLSYEALGLTPLGTAEKFIEVGDNTYGGKVVTNPSGGLLSKGHPLGATGLAQCAELVWQLRGTAGARQVEGARFALQHNIGLGGACVITLYER